MQVCIADSDQLMLKGNIMEDLVNQVDANKSDIIEMKAQFAGITGDSYIARKSLVADKDTHESPSFCSHYLEFARGDTFYEHDIYGKGIMIMKNGFCTASRKSKPGQQRWYTRRKPIGINDVLVESDFIQRFEQRRLLFYSYSLVLYIPRSVILEVLEKRPDIWKDCARWRYLQACLLKRAREKREQP